MTQQRDGNDAAIDQAQELPTPSHQGSGGGDLAREVGQRDEDKTAAGEGPENTRVQGADKPEDGDLPNPPQGQG